MSAPPPAAMAPHPGLAQRLRDGTWDLHSTAERAGIMPALLRGQLPLAGFGRLQRNLLAIYRALEPALARHAAHPALAPLAEPALARSAALAADLAALPPDAVGPADAPLAPATGAYLARLQRLDAQQPALLAAHAYVRYLGDLSGGQALRRIVRQAYGLTGEAGTGFFDFGAPDRVAALVRAFREGLNRLPLDEAGAGALVAEARWAFGQHARLFEELAAPTGSPEAR